MRIGGNLVRVAVAARLGRGRFADQTLVGSLQVIRAARTAVARDATVATVDRLKEGLLAKKDLLPCLQRRQFAPSALAFR